MEAGREVWVRIMRDAEKSLIQPHGASDAEENLADYLLRNRPTHWQYDEVLKLARKVATRGASAPGTPTASETEPVPEEAWRRGIIAHLKEYPSLGDCEWNCLTMGGFLEVIERIEQRGVEKGLERAAQVAEETISQEFRKGWAGGQHPRSEIVAKYTARAIRALAHPASAAGEEK